jgi:hypothetical protein
MGPRERGDPEPPAASQGWGEVRPVVGSAAREAAARGPQRLVAMLQEGEELLAVMRALEE